MKKQYDTVRAKINGNAPILIRAIVYLVGIIIAGTTVWASLNNKVSTNEVKIGCLEASDVASKTRLRSLEDSRLEQRADFKYIKQTMDEIKAKLK